MFDAKELEKLWSDAYDASFERLHSQVKLMCAITSSREAGFIALAAHVREQTLREAAGVVLETHVVSKYCHDDGYTTLQNAADRVLALSASARETGGEKC
jgi:hypothetical protein